MRKLIVITMLTLDGVMQAPGGKAEDTEDSFKYGGWQWSDSPDDGDAMSENLGKAGALLLGRKTYDIFAPYWPGEGREVPWYGAFMNGATKYVASTTLRKLEWENSVLLKGDPAEAVAGLKQEAGKDIYVMGSGHLCQTLMARNLIDEYVLMVYPLALGCGKRLFQEGGPKQDLMLLKSRATKNGVLELSYKVKKL